MRKLLLILFIFPCFVFAQQTINESIMHDNVQRDYILYVPASYNSSNPTPLLFNFHGYTSNASQQMWYGDFRSIADTANFLLVHPEGEVDSTGNTHWNVGWNGSIGDDIGFTAALIDSLSAEYNINQDRIYSTGMSNGGFMSFNLACNLSHRFAAIASVTGSMGPLMMYNCNPTHPTPVMVIHGTLDATVPYAGASWVKSISDVLAYWTAHNQCDIQSTVTLLPDVNIFDGSTVEHYLWENGLSGVEVEHYKVINGGHSWPGNPFPSAGTNYDIDASVEIWRFFSKYDINGLISSITSIAEVEKANKRLIKIVDVLGRERFLKENTLIFYIYDDGTVEKKIIIE